MTTHAVQPLPHTCTLSLHVLRHSPPFPQLQQVLLQRRALLIGRLRLHPPLERSTSLGRLVPAGVTARGSSTRLPLLQGGRDRALVGARSRSLRAQADTAERRAQGIVRTHQECVQSRLLSNNELTQNIASRCSFQYLLGSSRPCDPIRTIRRDVYGRGRPPI